MINGKKPDSNEGEKNEAIWVTWPRKHVVGFLHGGGLGQSLMEEGKSLKRPMRHQKGKGAEPQKEPRIMSSNHG